MNGARLEGARLPFPLLYRVSLYRLTGQSIAERGEYA